MAKRTFVEIEKFFTGFKEANDAKDVEEEEREKERLLHRVFGLENINFFELFRQIEKKVDDKIDGFENILDLMAKAHYRNRARAGELYFHISRLLSKLAEAEIAEDIESETTFSIEGVDVISKGERVLDVCKLHKYPFHVLMDNMVHSISNDSEQRSATDLLINMVRFVNREWSHKGSQTLKEKARGYPGSEEDQKLHLSLFGKERDDEVALSRLNCTPLESAVRRGLVSIVEAMMEGGYKKGTRRFKNDTGTNDPRRRDRSDGYSDIPADGNSPFSNRLYESSSSRAANRDTDGPDADLWSAPGRYILHFALNELPDMNNESRDAFSFTQNAVGSTQPTSSEIENRPSFWLASHSLLSQEHSEKATLIIRHLLDSCVVDNVTDTTPKVLVDRCGLLKTSDGSHRVGLQLLMQKAPSEVVYAFKKHLLCWEQCETHFSKQELSHESVLLQYRHLWTSTRMGVEALVCDNGLSLLHWLCLVGNEAVLEGYLNSRNPQIDKLLKRTDNLGWTPAHYAVYSGSDGCLKVLLDHSAGVDVGVDNVEYLIVNAPGEQLEGNTKMGPEDLKEISSEVLLISRGQTDPEFYQKRARSNTTGVTPLHLAAMFCHHECLDRLLYKGACTEMQSELERVDAHDVAIALYHRSLLQNEVKEARDDEAHQMVDEELKKVLMTLHNANPSKTRLASCCSAFLDIIPHVIIFTLLCLLTTWWVRTQADYLSVSAVKDNEVGTSFHEMKEIEDLHTWLQGPFLQLFGNASGVLLWEVVGSVRVVRLQGEQGKCNVPRWLFASNTSKMVTDTYKRHCYSAIEESDGGHTSMNTRKVWELSPSEYTFAVNDTHEIPNNRAAAAAYVEKLEKDAVFDEQTRAVLIWVNMHNPSVNTFQSITMLIEMPLEGSLYPFWGASVILPIYFSQTDKEINIHQAAIVLLFISLIYLLIVEIKDIHACVCSNAKYISRWKKNMKDHIYTGGKVDNTENVEDSDRRKTEEKETDKVLRTSRGTLFELGVILKPIKSIFWDFPLDYLGRDSNLLDVCGLVMLILLLVRHRDLTHRMADMSDEMDHYPPYSASGPELKHFYATVPDVKVAFISQNKVLGLNFIVYGLLLIKHIAMLPIVGYFVGPVADAVMKTLFSRNVIVFTLLWQLISLFFALGLYVMFGEDMKGYKSWYDTFLTIERHVMSDTEDFNDYYLADTYVGPFMWLALTFIIQIMLLNLLIGVLGVEYETQLQRTHDKWVWDMTNTYCVLYFDSIALDLVSVRRIRPFGFLNMLGKKLGFTCIERRGFPYADVKHNKVEFQNWDIVPHLKCLH